MALNMRLSKVVPPQPQALRQQEESVALHPSQSQVTCCYWHPGTPLHLSPAPDPVLLSQFLAKQIQQHDEIRQSGIAAVSAAATLLQNQELLNSLSLKDELLSNLCQELILTRAALSLLNPLISNLLSGNAICNSILSAIAKFLITGLLELVQLDRVAEQKSLQPVCLSDIVPGVVSTYQPLAKRKGVTLAYTVSNELPLFLV